MRDKITVEELKSIEDELMENEEKYVKLLDRFSDISKAQAGNLIEGFKGLGVEIPEIILFVAFLDGCAVGYTLRDKEGE